ncbi:MAG TPA: radical SAM protein, partial [Tenericutes bacterium]|nr:radical SAM protein [Mycoplasmatota bacterium]
MEDNKIILTTLSPKTHRTSEENLGIGYLKSSLTKKGYDVIIIDGWLNELTVEEVYEKIIKIDNVLFIGISTYMSNTQHTIDLIKMLKEKNKEYKILCGGFGPTFYPDEYLKNGADFVIRGEGEQVICKLADSLKYKQDQSDILSLSYIKNNNIIHNEMAPLVENLDIFPFPARDTLDVVINKKSTVNIVTSRGCSGNCDFCSVISFFRLSKGKVWRTRSIKNIVDEIEQLYKKGVTFIKVVDDSFIDGNRDEAWCKEFADEIEKRNIKVKLRGQIRADKVTDQILFHLKRAGFFSFACGIENGSETALKRMNKKSTLIENKKALELFKKHGYIVQMGYILFDKNTSLDELKDNYLFLNEYDFTVTKGI